MGRIKRAFNGNFTMIHNEYLDDKRLGSSELGWLTFMLSRPDNWNFCIEGLAKTHSDGKISIKLFLCEIYSVLFVGHVINGDKVKVLGLIYCAVNALLPGECAVGVFGHIGDSAFGSVIIHINAAVLIAKSRKNNRAFGECCELGHIGQ